MANDGGMYFFRQVGDVLWWLGASGGLMHPGLEFCNVFQGTVTASAVTGDWSCVPRGAAFGHGTLTLRPAGEHQLLRVGGSGGFDASIWRRTSNSAWPAIAVGRAFAATLRNVFNDSGSYAKATLADALEPIRDSVSVFAVVARPADDGAPPVSVSYPAAFDAGVRDFTYSEFICLNDPAASGSGDQPDGNATFWLQAEAGQLTARQPGFLAGAGPRHDQIEQQLVGPIEAAILMFGRSADCGDQGAETALPCFPGWAEPAVGSSVTFNGKPIRVGLPPLLDGPPGEPDFLAELSFGDPVRVTGALVYGGRPGRPEIHPVYAVEKITATFAADLSGAWADDAGNTYYLRHDLADDSIWYAAVSPLGGGAFGQVFRGSLIPGHVVGEVVALDFGYGSAPPSGVTGSRIGDTDAVAFGLGRAELAGREVPMLATGAFRLMKLYDA